MITEKVIESLYKTYSTRPESPDELDIVLLFEHLLDTHDIAIDDEAHLIINSFPPESPFHRIALKNIHAIVEFEKKIAIVLHSSIIFLNKENSQSYIHIRNRKPNIFGRIFGNMSALL